MTRAESNAAALVTLLPELHNHVHLIDPIRSCLGNLPSTEPGVEEYRAVKPIEWFGLETWEQCERYWIAHYRLDLVAEAFRALAAGELIAYHARTMALCVYYRYIEPWAAYRARYQDRHVTLGVRLMAESIPETLTPYQPLQVTQPKPREARRMQVEELLRAGYTVRRICRDVGCSDRLVAAVAATMTA